MNLYFDYVVDVLKLELVAMERRLRDEENEYFKTIYSVQITKLEKGNKNIIKIRHKFI